MELIINDYLVVDSVTPVNVLDICPTFIMLKYHSIVITIHQGRHLKMFGILGNGLIELALRYTGDLSRVYPASRGPYRDKRLRKWMNRSI